MIYKPEHNDIIINFYRATVYLFDKNNMQHYKDVSRCRYATFEEQAKFIKLGKEKAGLNEIIDLTIRNRSKWDKKEYPEIKIKLSERTFSNIIKLSNKLNIYSYEEIISKLFQMIDLSIDKKNEIDLKDLKRKYNKQKKILNLLKNELGEIEL